MKCGAALPVWLEASWRRERRSCSVLRDRVLEAEGEEAKGAPSCCAGFEECRRRQGKIGMKRSRGPREGSGATAGRGEGCGLKLQDSRSQLAL
eukprot:5130509-Pleurochrysis_carterae.AAC.3